ncbi:MAG: hypothetical protein WDO71_25940 [Bacteroidota bacterium]
MSKKFFESEGGFYYISTKKKNNLGESEATPTQSPPKGILKAFRVYEWYMDAVWKKHG